MDLKLWLSFLMLWVISDAQSDNSGWGIVVPSRIPAVHSSCVVIPCFVSYPKSRSKVILNRWIGIWWREKTIVSTNLPKWRLTDEFKRRTRFLGNLKYRNCTMLLDVVRSTDVGPFHFRMDIPQHKRSHSFINDTVTIDVIRKPEPPSLSVTVADKVTASCSVSHSCPYFLPSLTWNHAGVIKHNTKKLNLWQWETESQLTFIPRADDFNMTLSCTVKYRGGKRAESSTIILYE